MPKVSVQRLEPLFYQLSDRDARVRKEAKRELLSLEERDLIDSILLIELLFNTGLNGQIYAIQMLGRRNDPKTYPFLAEFFENCRSSLVLLELFETFCAINTNFFNKPILNKFRPNKKKKKKKKKEESKGDSDAMISFQCLVPAIKYLQEHADGSVTAFLKECLNHSNASVRLNALLAIYRRKLLISRDELIAINQKDSSKNVRNLADLILNPRENSEDDE